MDGNCTRMGHSTTDFEHHLAPSPRFPPTGNRLAANENADTVSLFSAFDLRYRMSTRELGPRFVSLIRDGKNSQTVT